MRVATEVQAEATPELTVGWVAVSGLLYRSLLVPIALISGLSVLGSAGRMYIPVVLLAATVNAWLCAGLVANRLTTLFTSSAFLIADFSFAFLANLWGAWVLPLGTLLPAGSDALWQYMLGTVIVWTSLRGWRMGAALATSAAILGGVAIALTSEQGAPIPEAHAVARWGWLVVALLVPLTISKLAGRGASTALTEGVVAGRAAERTQAQRDLHDTVVQTLGQVVQRSAATAFSLDDRLREIESIASTESRALGAALSEADLQLDDALSIRLRRLTEDFAMRGLSVELVMPAVVADFPYMVTSGVVGAVREALANTLKHSGVKDATVCVAATSSSLEIDIQDLGRGFDPDSTEWGFGLKTSIVRRMLDVGGYAEIHSRGQSGTNVRLVVPTGRSLQTLANVTTNGDPRLSYRSEAYSRSEGRALSWFAVPALTYRVCLTPLQVALAIATMGLTFSGSLWVAMLIVLVADIAILIGIARGSLSKLLRSRSVMWLDVAVACALNVWVAVELPKATAMTPGHQALWGYVFGVIVLWTAIRGARTGAVLVGVGALLEVAVFRVNEVPVSFANALEYLAQVGKLLAALALVWVIMRLARQEVRAAMAAGVQSGREEEKAEDLRALQNVSLETLSEIALLCAGTESSPEGRLRRVRGLALDQLATLRAAMHSSSGRAAEGLLARLQEAADEYGRKGLRVELVTAELTAQVPDPIADVLAGAVREALSNTLQHAGRVPGAVEKGS